MNLTPHTAMMAKSHELPQDSLISNYERTMAEIRKMGLVKVRKPRKVKLVDTMRDKHVWAALDDGCNSTCYGDAWGKINIRKMEKLGYAVPWVDEEERDYSGIGKKVAKGKRRWPACYRTTGSGGPEW